jgi:predicted nucleic acid-binding protein
MWTVVFDAGPLITACRFAVEGRLIVDYIAQACYILIAPSVEEEVAVRGAGYPNGLAAGERIVRGDIQVVPLRTRRWTAHLAGCALGDGERDSIELCAQTNAEALVTDDYLAFVTATRLGLRAWMLPDLIVQLVRPGGLSAPMAKMMLEVIRPRYRKGVIEQSMAQLEEVERDAEGHRAD